jgi:membrane-associated phospholipid phosphatase
MHKPSSSHPRRPVAWWNPFTIWLISITGLGSVLSYCFVDDSAQRFTAQFGFRGDFRALLDFIGYLGHGVFCAFVVITVLCLDWPKRKQAILIVMATLLSGGLTSAIKYSVHRERPALVAGRATIPSESMLGRASFQSFPSGHTATAFALATSLALIYPHGTVFFFVWATLVGTQRVLVQAHYPSDVFAGAMIGFIAAIVIRALFEKAGEP